MVAVIRVGSSIRRTFHYNENKVSEGVAELIMVENYPVEMENLDAFQRLNMLLHTAESNPNVRLNSVHISLNFSPEDALNDDDFKEIASEYMNAIGFGNQPYLVYRHDDAAHPHIHIATVKVDGNGQRIETQNIGKLLSEPARKAIESKYNLVRAEDQKRQVFNLEPVDVQKVQYGKSETKRAIGNVLEAVLNRYKYTTLPELNAVLNLYNVSAERGSEDSRTYKRHGLVYRVLDAEGQPVGVPIKASLFHNKPTLVYLEKRFLKNDVARQEHKDRVRATIDFAIKSRAPKSIEGLSEALKNSGIRIILRQNESGQLYGITYVDFKTKCVFNGSALGKSYSVKGMKERLGLESKQQSIQVVQSNKISQAAIGNEHIITPGFPAKAPAEKDIGLPDRSHEKSLLDELMQHEYASQQVPFEWRKKKKGKRKRR